MPPIVFPTNSAPGRDAIEGGGRLVNCYAEALQEGGPGTYVRRRAPGLTAFCETSETSFRGMWYDGNNYVYAAWEDELFYITSDGTETSVGALQSARLTLLAHPTDSTNVAVYTFAAVSFGTAHFNRRIVVGVHTAGGTAPTGVTCAGNAMTLVRNQGGDVQLYIVALPTGTSGDIVVTYGAGQTSCSIGVWRLDGVTSNTAHHSNGQSVAAGTGFSFSLNIPSGGVAVGVAETASGITWSGLTEVFSDIVEAVTREGASLTSSSAVTVTVAGTGGGPTQYEAVAASWGGAPGVSDIVTFAKNNATTPNQVLCTPTLGAFTFTTSAITVLNVNSEVPNSVCFGEGYFFFTTPGGLCYASGINVTTVNALDVIRAEAKPEALIRGIFFDGELYLFGQTHTEVWASGGNPNATGFPLNRTTVIWRGLVAPLAVCGFEDGFHPVLIFVADDNSVRMMQGYTPTEISPPDLNRAIEDCTDKSSIRMFVYHIEGHPCAVVDLAGEATWVYDLTTGFWHERKTGSNAYWRPTGNSVKAFGKWLVGDRDSGNIYEISKSALDDGGTTFTVECESIAMEAFPERLQIASAAFNFTTGVGTSAVPDPSVKISWSKDGGHTWSDPVTKKLGEAGRYMSQLRLNRLGLTGRKGVRFRVQMEDEAYFGLIGGDMTVSTRP